MDYNALYINSFSDFDALLKRHYGDKITLKFFLPITDYLYNSSKAKEIQIWCTSADVFLIDITHVDNVVTSHNTTVSTSVFFNSYFGFYDLPFNLYFSSMTATFPLMQDIENSGFISNDNILFLFTYASPRITVKKTVNAVNVVNGQYTKPITIKHFFIELKNIESLGKFNYIYIPKLNRWYYVKEKTQQNDFAVLELIEDVLMSFSHLISTQYAFIKRSESLYDNDMVDEEYNYEITKQISVTTITPTNDVYFVGDQDKPSYSVGYFILRTVG